MLCLFISKRYFQSFYESNDRKGHNAHRSRGGRKLYSKMLKICFAMNNLYLNVAKYEISAQYDI